MTWQKGISGNPLGRPLGARAKIAERIIDDLRDAWEQHGADVFDKLARENPVDFAKIATGILPRDVLISIEQRQLPGGISPDDWPLVVEVLEAVRAELPDASHRQPGEVFSHVRAALSLYGATQIEPHTGDIPAADIPRLNGATCPEPVGPAIQEIQNTQDLAAPGSTNPDLATRWQRGSKN